MIARFHRTKIQQQIQGVDKMASQMEVDGEPPPSIDCGGGLKRCSSAPMINMLVDCSPSTGPTSNSKQTMDDTGKPSSARSVYK